MNWESYYITEEEFMVLLAGKGMKSWYGLSSDPRGASAQNLKKEDIYRIIANLYQKEFVSWHGDFVKLEGFAAELIERLLRSDCCMRFQLAEEGNVPVIFYLLGGRGVMLEPSHTEQKKFRCSFVNMQDILEILVEEDIFPEEDILYDAEEESAEPSVENSMKTASFFFQDPRTGNMMGKIDVFKEGIDTFLKTTKGLDQQIVHYTPEHWQEQLAWIRSADK